MDEIQQQVLIENVVWISGLLAPLVVGVLTAVLARRPGADRVRTSFVGAVVAFALGAAGSYGAGETILGALMGGDDIPFNLVAQAWHRMWYPLGLGVLVGVGLALFALLPKRSAA